MSNILPYHHKKHIHQLRVLRLATATVWALILLVLAAGILLVPQLVMVDSHYSIAVEQVAQLERTGMVAAPADIASLEAKVNNLTTKLATPAAPAPTTYIAAVRAVASAGITLSGFSMEGTKDIPTLEVSGTSANRETLQRFVTALEATSGIASVDSPVSNYVKNSSNPFKITVTFKQP